MQPRALTAREELVRPPHLLVREQEPHQQCDRLALGTAMREPNRVQRARFGIERLLILSEVADPDRRADPDLARGGLELADDGLQEHALAGAVRADEADALAVHHRQLDAGQHDVLAELHADMAQLEDALAAALVRVQAKRDLAPLEHRALDLLHPVDLALLVPRLLDVPLVDDPVRPVLEPPDRCFEPLDLLLLRHVLLLLALQLELPGERVGGVVARPHADRAAVELGDLTDRLVEQVAVVRDGDDRSVEAGDEALEQRAADGVEVRFRLVEQQDIGILGEAGRERDQLSLAARQRVRRQRQVGLFEPEVEQRRPPTAVDARPAGFLPPLDKLLLATENALHLVQVGRELRRGELVRDPVQLAVELVQVGTRGAHGFERIRSSPSGCCGRNEVTIPRRRTEVPASGSSSPAMSRSMVDLPEPFAPITPTRARGSIAKSRPSSTVRLPNDLRTALRLTSATELPAANDGEHVLVLAVAQCVDEAGVARDPGSRGKHFVEPVVAQACVAARVDETRDHRERLPVRRELPRWIEVVLSTRPPDAQQLTRAAHRVQPMCADAEPCRQPRARERFLRQLHVHDRTMPWRDARVDCARRRRASECPGRSSRRPRAGSIRVRGVR